jgi:hypothetical protein
MAKKKHALASRHLESPADSALPAQQAQLHNLRLLRCTCATSLAGPLPPEMTQTITVSVAPWDNVKSIVAEISFSLVAANTDGGEGLRIEAAFGLTYDFPSLGSATEKDLREFCEVVGLNNTWPYWREFVQSMTSRMGLPPPPVLLLRWDQLAQTQDREPDRVEHPAKNKPNATG